jgi:hypothetical protein
MKFEPPPTMRAAGVENTAHSRQKEMKHNLTDVLIDLENAAESLRTSKGASAEEQLEALRYGTGVLIGGMRHVIERLQELERWT